MKTQKIIDEFQRIKSMGFIKSNRSNNTGIGKTFEDHLGVRENNKKDPDFEDFEVKSQRFLSKSKITLCTKCPTYPNGANDYLKKKYGEYDIVCKDVKILHTSFFGDRYNTYINKYGFKLKNDKRKKRVYLLIKDLKTDKLIKDEIYYTFEDIIESTNKLKNIFVVTADTKTKEDKEYFKYNNAVIFLNFNLDTFFKYIEDGKIQYDIRMGAYKSGKNKCKPHDHGNGFRIKRDRLHELYEQVIEI